MRLSLAGIVCLVLGLAGCAAGGSFNSIEGKTSQPPVGNAGGPYTGTAGTAIGFSGSGSTDPQGQVLTYAWNFGDNTTGTGIGTTHTYATPGTYTVTLTVTDTSNLTGMATSKATIAAAPLPPVANAGGPYTGIVGSAVSFNGGGSTDPQGNALTYSWNFGDGTTGTGASPSHTYAAIGTYNVTLTVTDTSNLTGTATSKATIAAAPLPPVANAGGPYTGTANTAVNFNGSGSSDPQGKAFTYAWNFGDGGTAIVVNPSHTYATAGTYNVTLTVTDTSNLTGTATSKATIAATPLPPVANAGGPYTGIVGSAASFNGTGSSDPQGQALTYAWNFGDGGTAIVVNPSHTYATAGTYNVTLTVTDTSNLTGTATSKATIAATPLPPVANAGGPYTGTANTAVNFNGSGSSDPKNQTLTYEWNFGDGGAAIGVIPTHTYTTPGTYTVTLAVTDTSNLTGTATSKATIAAAPLPPVANAGGPYTGTANTAVNFNGSGSSDPQGQALTYSWSFGDSTTGNGVSPSHTYSAPGTYTVTLTVTDTSNLTGTATSKATIAAAPLPPVANAGGPYTGTANTAVNFNGSGSSDPQGQALTYAWNFGDGGTGTGLNPTHTYSAPGTYTVTLTVTDTSNLTGTATSKATIAAAPMSPVANAGGPYTGLANIGVSFNGSGSTDPKNQPLTYAWNFGDGGTGTGVNPTHTYATPGTYTVTLTVTDTSNLTGTAITTATVTTAPPLANAGGPYMGIVDKAVIFNGSDSSDPQGRPLTYSWNFGDGTTGTGISPSHTYGAIGTYNVTLTLTVIANNLTSTAISTATIAAGSLTGSVLAGKQPIVGAHVYLFAANNTGYGEPSVSLLNATNTLHSDSVGAYVSTATDGSFSLTADYTCAVGQQLYIYALGGNPGSGTNSASGLLAAVGKCPSGRSSLSIYIDEATTVAAAYALAGFATDATHISSSGTALSQTGIANAFLNAANLVSLSTGQPLTILPNGNGIVPQSTIDTLANILSACVKTSGPSSAVCSSLFSSARSGGSSGTVPTDTATVAINIAHNPGSNVSALYNIAITSSTFAPALTAQPNDFTLALVLTGGSLNEPDGIAIDGSGNGWVQNDLGDSVTLLQPSGIASNITGYGLYIPNSIAIDDSGNAWIADQFPPQVTKLSRYAGVVYGFVFTVGYGSEPLGIAIDGAGNAWLPDTNGTLTELSSSGSFLLGDDALGFRTPSGIAIDNLGKVWISNTGSNQIGWYSNTKDGYASYTGGGLDGPTGIAIDSSGNVWTANVYGGSVTKFSRSGSVLSGTNGFTGGGLCEPTRIAIDGSGNAWVTNKCTGSITELSSSGALLSGGTGFVIGGLNLNLGGQIAIDGSGNVWVTSVANNEVIQLIGAATPVVTPLATGVKNNTLGTRP